MRAEELEALLIAVRDGTTSPDDAMRRLRELPYDDVGFARLDTHRELRQGIGEAIYAEGKTPEQVVAIATRLLETTTSPVLATRATPEIADALRAEFPAAESHERARLVVLRKERSARLGTVAVLAAGTSDLPVAEEAAVVCREMGCQVHTVFDVGVAGLHRLFEPLHKLLSLPVDVLVVAAGMDGALPSVVSGLVDVPVIGLPTSVGYGLGGSGEAALLSMLQTCAPGLAVVNIDNGVGAGAMAGMIARRCALSRETRR